MLGHGFSPWDLGTGRGSIPPLRRFFWGMSTRFVSLFGVLYREKQLRWTRVAHRTIAFPHRGLAETQLLERWRQEALERRQRAIDLPPDVRPVGRWVAGCWVCVRWGFGLWVASVMRGGWWFWFGVLKCSAWAYACSAIIFIFPANSNSFVKVRNLEF